MTAAPNLTSELRARLDGPEPRLVLGGASHGGVCLSDVKVSVPLATLNRHGLVAGATGTGKTKTLQVLAEQLALCGVPSLVMDIKGDLSGLAAPGLSSPRVTSRHELLGLPWQPRQLQTEFLSLSGEPGVVLRSTVSEFGPVLCAKLLGLNATQAGVLSVLFRYCDDNGLPLVDTKDLKSVLLFASNDGRETIQQQYGRVAPASLATMLRSVVDLEQQGADRFFGEPSFDVNDLLRRDEAGRGIISILRLTDVQDRPRLFSTFMLGLMAELYATLPEAGDLAHPKLVLFIDEAHLVFDEATSELLRQLETIVKLIRSKGVGLIFVTQDPADVPDAILGQLGLRVQHALRAVTARDRKAIKLAAQNFPQTTLYDVPRLLTELGTGEALVTGLDIQGRPTPLLHTIVRAPETRMGVLTPEELQRHVSASALVARYGTAMDQESAHEILARRLSQASGSAATPQTSTKRRPGDAPKRETAPPPPPESTATFIEDLSKNPLVRQVGRTVARELVRGLLGAFGFNRRR